MKKISTLFKKDPTNLGRVINEINPENAWVIGNWIPTRKYDGTACAIINWELYKRYDVKRWMTIPDGAIACQEPDEVTWHHPHWVKCDRADNGSKYHFIGFDNLVDKVDWTYELCWEKVQGNPEKITGHVLIKHGADILEPEHLSFEWLKDYLTYNDIEGIVFHERGWDRMCKIRKSDFWIKRV